MKIIGSTDKSKNRPYTCYIMIGFLYVIVKIIFVSLGYLHTGAIFHGLIPSILTVASGFFALNERDKGRFWHKVLLIFPILSLIITPTYMYLREYEMWLTNGRLEVLIIYEIFAVIQFVLAFVCTRNKKNI